jgi:hypothetical protein
VIGEDDELSHDGGESEFFGFATSEETEVERSEDRVVPGGDEGGHVGEKGERGQSVILAVFESAAIKPAE